MFSPCPSQKGFLQIQSNDYTFSPSYPINVGVGLGIRNTVVNILLGHSIAPLKGDKYGKTKAVDLQVHSYGRYYLIDLYYQKYRVSIVKTKMYSACTQDYLSSK